jgi:hypothetical protein
VITSFREPIAHKISSIFHHGFKDHGVFSTHFTGLSFDESIPMMHGMLISRLENFNEANTLLCNWFTNIFKPVFDFDIYSQEFDKEKGYEIYHAKDFDILCFKLEKLGERHKEAFEEFLGVKDFSLVNKNVSSEKHFGPFYKKTRESIKIPEDILEAAYASDIVRHFYSEKELDGFKEKWSGRERQNRDPREVERRRQVEQFNFSGEQSFAAGDNVNALQQFGMALKLNPLDKTSVINCTRTLARLGDFDNAIKICADYLSVISVDKDVMDNLTVFCREKKELASV